MIMRPVLIYLYQLTFVRSADESLICKTNIYKGVIILRINPMMDEVSRTFVAAGRHVKALLASAVGIAARVALALSYLFWALPYHMRRR